MARGKKKTAHGRDWKSVTTFERDRRIAQVEQWCALLLKTSEIEQNIIKEWGVSRATAWRYIREVRAGWAAQAAAASLERRSQLIRLAELCLQRAIQDRKWGDAARWFKELRQVEGIGMDLTINQTNVQVNADIQVESRGPDLSGLSRDERNEVRAIMKKLTEGAE